MKLIKYIFLGTCFTLLNPVYADCTPDSESNYEQILKRATNNALPGAGFYYKKGNCIINLAKGHSNLRQNIELKNTDRFVIGSITKMFTAVTSVKLAKSGVFNLDDVIDKWLPTTITSRIPNSGKITIRHLLSHSSGIFDYINDGTEFTYYIFSNPGKLLTELDALKYVYDKPSFFKPGTEFKYSNTNYLLMGLIINHATNKPFATNIRELILEPLSLNDTFHLSQPGKYLDYAHGYYFEEDGVLHDGHELVKNWAFADGAMVSSMQDLATFIQSIFKNKSFMSNELLDTLLSSPVANSSYGLGITHRQEGSIIRYGHGGYEYGYQTSLSYSPANNETRVDFVTGSDGVMDTFSQAYSFELARAIIQTNWHYTLAP